MKLRGLYVELLFVVLCIATCICVEADDGNPSVSISGVVDLTPSNFDRYLDGSRHVFLEAYAPWCGHCKSFVPEFVRLGEAYLKTAGVEHEIILAKVNADEHKELAARLQVQGFPTFKWYTKGSKAPEDYSGGRQAEEVVDFILQKTGVQLRIPQVISAVLEATSENFDTKLLNQKGKVRLVEFFAPWCGHCKRLAPIYEQLASAFVGEPDVIIAKVDATKEPGLAERFSVKGYPTLLFFPIGASDADSYDGSRELDALVSFINGKAGTMRQGDGRLNSHAGRLSALDIIASKMAAGMDPSSVLEEMRAKAFDMPEDQYYVRVAEKAVANPGYIQKEAHRLETLLQKGVASREQLDGMKKRLNVLRVFAGDA